MDIVISAESAFEPAAIDRCAQHRHDEQWLGAAWERAQVLVVCDGQALIHEGAPVYLPSGRAPTGERYLLGLVNDVPYFAVSVSEFSPAKSERAAGLRELLGLLEPTQAALTIQAVGLDRWHRAHPYCARCGAATAVAQAGYVRTCPQCAAEHHPRVDPAVIMLVHDENEEAILARGVGWPQGQFSTLAGFVEPGESLEQAVAREVAEEVGLEVISTRYFGSQPWPFPSSLMIGFVATVRAHAEPEIDPTEIAEARWFSRERFIAARASGEIRASGNISISSVLIRYWLET
ncbi:MAG: NAD(+) diphosphatase [Corynebacteriales bacterium]|nr:NAD(+) diphosphatase [Mycobacteriales bacterium]